MLLLLFQLNLEQAETEPPATTTGGWETVTPKQDQSIDFLLATIVAYLNSR